MDPWTKILFGDCLPNFRVIILVSNHDPVILTTSAWNLSLFHIRAFSQHTHSRRKSTKPFFAFDLTPLILFLFAFLYASLRIYPKQCGWWSEKAGDLWVRYIWYKVYLHLLYTG